jgi:hypothetical protein
MLLLTDTGVTDYDVTLYLTCHVALNNLGVTSDALVFRRWVLKQQLTSFYLVRVDVQLLVRLAEENPSE